MGEHLQYGRVHFPSQLFSPFSKLKHITFFKIINYRDWLDFGVE